MNRRFRILSLTLVATVLTGIIPLSDQFNMQENGSSNISMRLRTSADEILFLYPDFNGTITQKYNYTLNVSAIISQAGSVAYLRIFSTNESNPELDWSAMDSSDGDYWNYTIDPIDFPIGTYNFTVNRSNIFSTWFSNSTMIDIDWLANDSITFLNPLPSELITQNNSYTINAINNVSDSFGDAQLRIFSTDDQNPELDWINMTQSGNFWNYTIDPENFSIYLNYNFSIRIQYAPSVWFINSTLAGINVSSNSSGNGNNNPDDPNNNPLGNKADPMALLFIMIFLALGFTLAGYVGVKDHKKKKKRIDTKGVWIEEIRNKNETILNKLTIKAKPKTEMSKFEKARIEMEAREQTKTISTPTPKPHKLKPSTYEEPKGLTDEEQRELEQTQSEMEVFESRHICVVHKGRIDGKIYICPECQTVYCIACAELLRMKNETCFSCEKPITI